MTWGEMQRCQEAWDLIDRFLRAFNCPKCWLNVGVGGGDDHEGIFGGPDWDTHLDTVRPHGASRRRRQS